RCRSTRGRSRRTASTRRRWRSSCVRPSSTSSVITSAWTTRRWSASRTRTSRGPVGGTVFERGLAGRRLVDALTAVASRYEPDARKEKVRLLDALADRPVGRPGPHGRLHAAVAEGEACSEGGMGWRAWLGVAKGGRPMTDLQLLLELFERTGLPEETRDWLYESLALPVVWRPRGVGASRTLARVPPARVFF